MTAYTTISAVRMQYGDTDIQDDVLNQFIQDASMQVQLDNFSINFQEIAARYWTCHLLYLREQANDENAKANVTVEQVSGIKRQFSSYSGSKSEYNDRYERLYDKLKEDVANDGSTDNMAVFY